MPERTCRFRRCVAQTREGTRCKNCINVRESPDQAYCWLHRTRLDAPDGVFGDIGKSLGVVPDAVLVAQIEFEALIQRTWAGQGIDLDPYLCCSIPEYFTLMHMFRAIGRRPGVSPSILLNVGFLLFYAMVKFEQTDVDLTIKEAWRATSIPLVTFGEFRRLFFEIGDDPDVRGVLMGRRRRRRR